MSARFILDGSIAHKQPSPVRFGRFRFCFSVMPASLVDTWPVMARAQNSRRFNHLCKSFIARQPMQFDSRAINPSCVSCGTSPLRAGHARALVLLPCRQTSRASFRKRSRPHLSEEGPHRIYLGIPKLPPKDAVCGLWGERNGGEMDGARRHRHLGLIRVVEYDGFL
jgi:hypothetical protein